MAKRAATNVKPIAQCYFGQIDRVLESYLQQGKFPADARKVLKKLAESSFFAALPSHPTPVLAPLFVLGRTVRILMLLPKKRLQALELILLTLSQVEGYSDTCLEETFLFESLCDPFGGKLLALGILLAGGQGRGHEAQQLQHRLDAYTNLLDTQTEHVFGTALFYTRPTFTTQFFALFDEDAAPTLPSETKLATL